LAGIQNGFTPVWASEIEKFPITVTKYHFPQMMHLGDITKLHGANVPVVEVITGGSPCQDLSVAGKRAGLTGTRSGLFLEQVRLIKEMRRQDERRMKSNQRRADQFIRPRYMVWENVPGAFSSGESKGADFKRVLEEVCCISEESVSIPGPPKGSWTPAGLILGERFSVAWRVLDAQFWGVPQRRNRIFLIADFNGGSAGQILFESESVWRHYQKMRKKRTQATNYFGRSIEKSGYDGDTIEKLFFEVHSLDARYSGPVNISPTLTTNMCSMSLAINQEPYCIAGNIINRKEKNGGNGSGVSQGISFTLTTQDRHCIYVPKRGLKLYQDVIGTLCAGDEKWCGNQYVGQGKCIVDGMNMVRRIMPVECERLMGYPDGWTDVPGASDSCRYKALGNSVAVPCVDFILSGIAFFLSQNENKEESDNLEK